MTRANLPLTCTALLLLSIAVWCLATLLAGPATAQSPEQGEPPSLEPADVLADALVSETISPTTVLDLFFASSEVQWSPETSASEPAGSESLAADAAHFSGDPVFSWNPGGGTYSMDWGDVDRDGDLDLVTGSADSVTAYLNDQGQLVQLWTKPVPGLGVRWFDRAGSPTANPALEVVVVGASIDGQPSSPGTMELYLQAGSDSPSVEPYDVPAQLLRVEPRDYDGDGGIDLLVSTNALDPPGGCPVLLYRRDSVDLPYDSQPECVSNEATASLAAANADGDNGPDLALALHMSKELRVVINTGGVLTVTNSVLVDSALPHIPYDLAWGDYDGDGQLDLAAAFPLEQEVRVYRATSTAPLAYTWAHTLTTTALLTPLALDWADVDGDGQLELIVGDLPPTVYDYDRGADSFAASGSIPITSGRIQEIRAINTDDDADLDLSVADQYGPSQLYENLAPILGSHLELLPQGGDAEDVAWGDYSGDDGLLDLAVATSGTVLAYASSGNGFATPVDLVAGPASCLAWGDLDGDGDLDLAVAGGDLVQIYENTGSGLAPDWGDGWTGAGAVAWADWNSDERLDLAVAGSQGVRVYGHDGSGLSTPPVFTAALNALDVAWADYDGDFYPDLAVASTQGIQVYHNQIGVLTPLWSQPVGDTARSVAWADYDGDGWPELAAGRYGPANLLYDNQGGVLSSTPAYIGGSGAAGNTTKLAWGDPDGDGDLDLAVANDGGADLIYANDEGALTAGPDWQSPVISATTSLAWGDLDGDGDLDLAFTAGDGSGWYANNRSLPSHLGSVYVPLAQNPAMLSMARPGAADDAYFFSATEVLGTPTANGLVPFEFSYDDPEEELWTEISLQYSLDGSGTWQTTPNFGYTDTVVPGFYTGEWDAHLDQAVSEDARLRLVAIDGTRSGPVQWARVASTSPPFRVRGTDCIWPSDPTISYSPTDPEVGEKVTFNGDQTGGIGLITFVWDFGGGITKQGQEVSYYFQAAGEYEVKLTVTGEACPVTRPVMTQTKVTVVPASSPAGSLGQLEDRLYLPLITAGAPPSATSDLLETER